MKKSKLLLVFIFLFAFMSLSACNGYNLIMYKELSDENSYHEYTMVVAGFSFFNETKNSWQSYDFCEHTDADEVFVDVFLKSKEDFASFSGVGPEVISDESLKEETIKLEINNKNNAVLISNGFYDDVKPGDEIVVSSSNFIYMDSDFFYIRGVGFNGTIYLDCEVGLQNIIEVMDENRSLF